MRPRTLLLLGASTAAINWLIHYLGPYIPDWVPEYFEKVIKWIADKTPNWIAGPAVDFIDYLNDKLGFKDD